jgi:hypothetical protein
MKNDPTNGPIKPRVDLVWIRCRRFNCLAYSNAVGKWINFYTGKKVTDFVRVIG